MRTRSRSVFLEKVEYISHNPSSDLTISSVQTLSSQYHRDSYCFKCHLLIVGTSNPCSQCKSNYHLKCSNFIETCRNKGRFTCEGCVKIEDRLNASTNIYGLKKIDVGKLEEGLMIILKNLNCYKSRHFRKEIIWNNGQAEIVTQLSFPIIEKRIAKKTYEVSEAFLHDLSRMEHNWIIFEGRESSLLTKAQTWISNMEACYNCFMKTRSKCSRQHLLIWAKSKNGFYWPATLLGIEQTDAIVDYFGKSEVGYVNTSNCILMCERDPNDHLNIENTKDYEKSIKSKESFIVNLRKKYGEFNFAEYKKQLDPTDIQSQIRAMLPRCETIPELSSVNLRHCNRKRSSTYTFSEITPKNRRKSVSADADVQTHSSIAAAKDKTVRRDYYSDRNQDLIPKATTTDASLRQRPRIEDLPPDNEARIDHNHLQPRHSVISDNILLKAKLKELEATITKYQTEVSAANVRLETMKEVYETKLNSVRSQLETTLSSLRS